jgi:Flp pilus assembly protein TadG
MFRRAFRNRSRHSREGVRLTGGPRGQAMVEFALVLPLLLVFFLGVADFARVFTAGITMEAAARDGAEAAAQEYLQLLHKTGGSLSITDYDQVHTTALKAVCAETEPLPNQVTAGATCSMPLAAACVHDGVDPLCGSEANASVTQCTGVNGPWDSSNLGATPGGAPALPYVEVRACYRFTTLVNLGNLNLPFGWSISLGDIWLQRDREFTVASY